jgi:GNAT superfamily N-acetyltransferase
MIIKAVSLDNRQLLSVIYSAIGNPSPDRILEVIRSYSNPEHEIIGAFIDDILVGVLGFVKESETIAIRHISIIENWQRQGLGTLLLEEIKKYYKGYNISAETDEESVDFYLKSGFICREFQGLYGNLRYKCYYRISNEK